MVPEVAGSNPVSHPPRGGEHRPKIAEKKVRFRVLTPLGNEVRIFARRERRRTGRHGDSREGKFPTVAPATENTPRTRPKLIENRGFECIERAHKGGHYVPSGPGFGRGGSKKT